MPSHALHMCARVRPNRKERIIKGKSKMKANKTNCIGSQQRSIQLTQYLCCYVRVLSMCCIFTRHSFIANSILASTELHARDILFLCYLLRIYLYIAILISSQPIDIANVLCLGDFPNSHSIPCDEYCACISTCIHW